MAAITDERQEATMQSTPKNADVTRTRKQSRRRGALLLKLSVSAVIVAALAVALGAFLQVQGLARLALGLAAEVGGAGCRGEGREQPRQDGWDVGPEGGQEGGSGAHWWCSGARGFRPVNL